MGCFRFGQATKMDPCITKVSRGKAREQFLQVTPDENARAMEDKRATRC
jgi:hypothetical protein